MTFSWLKGYSSESNSTGMRDRSELRALDHCLANVEFTVEGNVTKANENFLRLFGYDMTDLKGRNYSSLFAAAMKQPAEGRRMWERVCAGDTVTGDFCCKTKNNRELWMTIWFLQIRDGQGNLSCVVAYMCDITEKTTRQRETQSLFAATNCTIPMMQLTLDGTVLEANQVFLDAAGCRLEQMQGRHHSQMLDKTFAESSDYRKLWSAVGLGESQSCLWKFNSAGRAVWFEVCFIPVTGDDGKPCKVLAMMSIITDRYYRNIENDELKLAVNRSNAVINFQPDGTIVDANENFLNAMGYGINEIRGNHHSMFIAPETKSSPEYQRFWEDLRKGIPNDGEFLRFGKGGRKVWISAAYIPIKDADGKVHKVIKFARDITNQILARNEIGTTIDGKFNTIVNDVSVLESQSRSAAEASLQTLETVQSVASAAEELNASIREIAESMSLSRSAVTEVARETSSADESTGRLGEKASAMSKVVELIKEIAEQINLLSLNAAIESARAGDAGRGFAVVASEVKNLANQVQNATGNISKEILEMQTVSQEVVRALTTIRKSVDAVEAAVSGTASAVEEQSVVTREISSNMMTATKSVDNVNADLNTILQSVETIDFSARDGRSMLTKLVGNS